LTVGIALLIAGAVLIAVEMHTLTIYLIAVAAACFASASVSLAVHPGIGVTAFVFALTLFGVLPVAHLVRRRLGSKASEEVSRDDVGQVVTVTDASCDGDLRVTYRGAPWDARLKNGAGGKASPGDRLWIVARDGNTLFVEKEPPEPGAVSQTA